jgi:spermidine synthase
MLHRQWVTRLLVGLFLASGATSLVYEVLWARQLHLIFGTSQLAISTVLAAFMAGLAAGGFAAARFGARVRRPLIAYAALEAFIGAYAIAFPWILELARPLYLAFWRSFEPGLATFGAFQLVLLGALLLPPTMCMGATLPLLVRFVTASTSDTGFQVGRLYGANTLGAVLGTGLAGFVLLPWLGLARTTYITAAANGVLALAALGLAHLGRMAERPADAVTRERETHAEPEPAYPALLWIAGLGGFSSLLYEVAWFRVLTLMLGGSTYAFTTMLLAFLMGIGLGGWAGGALADLSYRQGGNRRVLVVVASLQVGVALLSWGAMYLYGQLPVAIVALYDRLKDVPVLLWAAQLLLALAVMLPAALLMGATFPYLVRAAAGAVPHVGRVVGRLYGMNTLGAIAGAAGGGLFLLPALTVRGAVLAAASVNLMAALIAGVAAGALRGRRFAVATAVVLAAVVLAHWRKPPWNPLLMTSGAYLYASELFERTEEGLIEFAVTPFTLLYYVEGRSSVVSVGKDHRNLWLANNGKVDASLADLDTQVLVAHLPFLFHPEAKRVLVIGLASGITTGSVTLHTAVQLIDVAELEPAMVGASHHFDDYNHRPLDDPRVRLHLNDGRNHLLLAADGAYDLVSSEPSNPWLSGVSNLFTREFFELGKRKMAPGGVWAQWVQTYGMGPEDVRSLLVTFADVYFDVRLFRIDESDLVLIGSDRPLTLDASGLRAILERNDLMRRDLEAIGINRPEDLLGLYQFSRDTILGLAGEVERNTDDNMRIEYSAPLSLHAETQDENSEMLEAVAESQLEAVESKDGLLALALAYARSDPGWRRTFHVLEHAASRFPGDPDVAALHQQVQAEALEWDDE